MDSVCNQASLGHNYAIGVGWLRTFNASLEFMPFQSVLAKVSWSTLAQGATWADPTSTPPDHAGRADIGPDDRG